MFLSSRHIRAGLDPTLSQVKLLSLDELKLKVIRYTINTEEGEGWVSNVKYLSDPLVDS